MFLLSDVYLILFWQCKVHEQKFSLVDQYFISKLTDESISPPFGQQLKRNLLSNVKQSNK